MKIHIIAAALPPEQDGIGDYTACLAAEMARSMSVTVLTGAQNPSPIPGVCVKTAFSAEHPAGIRQVCRLVELNKPNWVLLQYNPFSYGRWGLNLHLPEAMRRLRVVSPGTRVAVMVHEPFVPVITPQFAVMAAWQRWQLWRLGQNADIVFFSIEAWQRRFQRWFPSKPVSHLPVGSNIPFVPFGRAKARARLGISEGTLVLGLFGTAGSGRMLHRAREALDAVEAAGMTVQLVYIGPDNSAVCTALGTGSVIAGGPYPAEEVSRRLSAIDISLAAYVDGVSTRRGAFMAGLQHGLATVATRGPLTDSLLERKANHAFLLADTSDAKAFASAVCSLAASAAQREKLGQAAQQLYEREFAWEKAVRTLQAAFASASKN